MIKIWGRIEKDHKIVRQVVYENDDRMEWHYFF